MVDLAPPIITYAPTTPPSAEPPSSPPVSRHPGSFPQQGLAPHPIEMSDFTSLPIHSSPLAHTTDISPPNDSPSGSGNAIVVAKDFSSSSEKQQAMPLGDELRGSTNGGVMETMMDSPTLMTPAGLHDEVDPFQRGVSSGSGGQPIFFAQTKAGNLLGGGVRSMTAPVTSGVAGRSSSNHPHGQSQLASVERPLSTYTDESVDHSHPFTTTYPEHNPYPQGSIPGPSSQPQTDLPPRELHSKSLSAYISSHPSSTVKHAISKTYPKPNPLYRLIRRFKVKHDVISGLSEKNMRKWDEREGEKARREAGWGRVLRDGEPVPDREVIERKTVKDAEDEKPAVSELFWKMYMSLLPTIQRDPLSGLVCPPLLGSTTTMPVSIISLIPDIMRHYRDVIVRAEKEIFLVTNYWQPSNSVTTISGALRELSDKVTKRREAGEQVDSIIVKLVYDRGSWEQLWNSHAAVKPTGWGELKIPLPAEIPGLDLEVINFHRVLLGTFHAKFMIVDRKVALINSNNIQDRPNLEMMTHLEGPIVDSFYEVALHSWYNKLSPMMPCAGTAYQPPKEGYRFSDANPYLRDIEVLKAARAARRLLRRETAAELERESPHRFRDVVRQAMERAGTRAGASWDELFAHNDMEAQDRERERGMDRLTGWADRMRTGADKVRTGFYSRSPSRRASYDEKELMVRRASAPVINRFDPQPASEAVDGASQGSPTLNGDSGEHLPKPKAAAEPTAEVGSGWKKVRLDLPEIVANGDGDVASAPPPAETANGSGITGRERSGSNRMKALSTRFNAGANSEAWATVEDTDDLDTFAPHVIHKPHKPFPIAMCNRKPHGLPGHHDIRNPQNAAWLAGCRYAQKKIWIQTPTLNARPIRRAIKHACRRGVEVVLFLDLGFNDQGESIPFQGGTNEQVVERLYGILRKEQKEQFLKVYWYTGKDQIRPLNAIHKQRNCHIKFAMFDDQVAILGNGNQDTQSWMHSQETNVMIDSKEIIAELMEVLYTNQNTHKYGLVGTDGIWRDAEGNTVNHYDGTKKSKHPGLEGFIRFAKTI